MPMAVSATHCVIENCRTTILNKPPGVSFHSCPSNNEMRKRWLRVLKNKCTMLDWYRSQICSKHFESKCFDSNKKLRENAVPTVFAPVFPRIAPKPPVKSQNKNSKLDTVNTPSSKTTTKEKPSHSQKDKKELTNKNKKSGFISRVPWNYEAEPQYGVELPRSRVDRLLNKLSQAELTANIKINMNKLKEPSDLDLYVTDDLRCRPEAPKEAALWLMIKKQENLNNRLMDLVVQTKKHVEILQNHSETAKTSKLENE
ncbi:uncharacterized protein LOC124639136 [Helicoverpa zea]|uniref:uncharacterized protein LOC124639136 n=1 Tax=Helicoverpa zea TaxID=7113 RepID=UPI001F5A24FF|nr:uncharacterized protein LOC124639136 [Helicoverpa zea]